MGWSWQVPTRFQIKKYEPDNMIRYLKYLKWVGQQLWDKLKFLDEAHVVLHELHKKKFWGWMAKELGSRQIHSEKLLPLLQFSPPSNLWSQWLCRGEQSPTHNGIS